MTEIDKTARVAPAACLDDDVVIGAYSVIGQHVRLGRGVHIHPHVVITGKTTIGAGSVVYPFASIGHVPQDIKYEGEESSLSIGTNVTIREHVTINPGTRGGGLETRIGNHCLLMVGSHVAHDCHLGNHIIMANNAMLAGHVVVGDHVTLGGLCGIHQYVRLGSYAMIAGLSGVTKDVIPYGFAMGYPAGLCGLNLVGLRRHGFQKDSIKTLHKMFDTLFKTTAPLVESYQIVSSRYGEHAAVRDIISFMKTASKRGLCSYTKERYGIRTDDAL